MSDALERLGSRIAERLAAAGVPDEQLAELVPARRRGPFTRRAHFVGSGRAWRLGAVLVDRAGRMWLTGTVTRAVEPRPFASDKTLAGEQRREWQRLAARAFRADETVDFGHRPIELGDGDPVTERDGVLVLRLPDAEVDLAGYLEDRAALAVDARAR